MSRHTRCSATFERKNRVFATKFFEFLSLSLFREYIKNNLVLLTRTHTYTRIHARTRVRYTESMGNNYSRWGGGRGGLGIVCPREVSRKNRQKKVGRCKTSGRLSCGNTPVRVIGVGVYRGEVTGNRPRLTDIALPLCKRLSLSSGVSAVLQSHSSRVCITAPYRRLSRRRGCFIFGGEVKTKIVSSKRGKIGMLTVLTLLLCKPTQSASNVSASSFRHI